MSNYSNTKATIAANVYTNHNNEVTAAMVKAGINSVVDALIAGGYLWAGVAHPGDAASTPDANVVKVATEVGTYTNYKNSSNVALTVAAGEVAVFTYNGSWSKEVTGAATAAQVSALGHKVGQLNLSGVVLEQGGINNSGVDFSAANRVKTKDAFSTKNNIIAVPDGFIIKSLFYYTAWENANNKTLAAAVTGINAQSYILGTTHPLARLVIAKTDDSNLTADEVVNAFPNPQAGFTQLYELAQKTEMLFESGTISPSIGTDQPSTFLSRSVLFPCSNGSIIEGLIYRVYLYDADFSFLGEYGTSYNGYTIVQHTISNASAAYVRITIRKESILKSLTIGGQDVAQLPLKYLQNLVKILPALAKYSDNSFISILTPGSISSSTGQDEANALLHRSTFLRCKVGEELNGYLYRVLCYDENLGFLGEEGTSYTGGNIVTHTVATQNTAYVRVTILNGYIHNPLFVNGLNSYDCTRAGDGGLLDGIKLGSTPVPVVSKQAIIPSATSLNGGYMSAEDKAKLDGITGQMTINISGSGVTKNASAYGFLPTNDGATNSAALQDCLDGGGLILIDFPGFYEVSATHYLDSNTHIVFGENVYIKRVVDSTNHFPRHIFVNRGAFTYTYNNDIIIDNLKILPNGPLDASYNPDVNGIIGLRGLLAFFYVRNLVLNGVEIIDHTYAQYSIHICTFENIICDRIHIETLKDGIHLGDGRGFVIRNCQFLTDDDALAFNAVDYPGSNAAIGWLEDGIVENITFLKKPEDGVFRDNRGSILLSGAWKEWVSGMSFRTNGDIVTSDGKIYQTYKTPIPDPVAYLTSTVQPTHTSGAVTGSDGLTWLYKGVAKANNAGIRRVHFKNLYFYRKCPYLFLNYSEVSKYMRGFYPGSDGVVNEDITFEQVYNLNASGIFLQATLPIDNIKFINNKIDSYTQMIHLDVATDVPNNQNVHIALVGNSFSNTSYIIGKGGGDWTVTENLVGSLKASGFTANYAGITPTFINNDLV